MDIPFAITQSPACSDALTYELVPNTNAFLSIVNPTATSGSVRISGATNADANVYSIVLRATATNAILVDASFDVTIICAVTSFTIANPIVDLSHLIESTALTTTSFSLV